MDEKRILDDNDLNQVSGGISQNDESNEEKWLKVGIKVIQANGFAEYFLIKDNTRISPQKALEIYLSQNAKEN